MRCARQRQFEVLWAAELKSSGNLRGFFKPKLRFEVELLRARVWLFVRVYFMEVFLSSVLKDIGDELGHCFGTAENR